MMAMQENKLVDLSFEFAKNIVNLVDVVDWVAYASVLCNALVCEVNLAFSVYCYVLEESVAVDCVVDIRF